MRTKQTKILMANQWKRNTIKTLKNTNKATKRERKGVMKRAIASLQRGENSTQLCPTASLVNAATVTVLMRRNAMCRRIYVALNTNSSHPVISNTIGQLQLGKPQNSKIFLLAIRLIVKHYYRFTAEYIRVLLIQQGETNGDFRG